MRDPHDLGLLLMRYPCRGLQLHQLCVVLDPRSSNPSALVIHGPRNTGKSAVVRDLLGSSGVAHRIIQCSESITVRHLLERTISACRDAVPQTSIPAAQRCESISALVTQLQEIFRDPMRKFYLVFDGIDKQRELSATILPGLARLGEMVPGLTVIFIVTFPSARCLHTPGTPHIAFPPYNREQALQVLSLKPLPIFPASVESIASAMDEDPEDDDSAWVWSRFTAAVWDSLGKSSARDIVNLQSVASKLWRPFVEPIVDGSYGTRDFSKLMVRNRMLFRDEGLLVDHVLSGSDLPARNDEKDIGSIAGSRSNLHDLPYYSKYLLCAAYLASYNPPRLDPIHFMKSSEKRKKKRGGATVARREAKARRFNRRLLGPQAFITERMLAIFQAILPHQLISTVDIHTQIATLASMRLLVLNSSSADVLEPQTKWRVNVGWEYVQRISRSIKLNIEDYLAE